MLREMVMSSPRLRTIRRCQKKSSRLFLIKHFLLIALPWSSFCFLSPLPSKLQSAYATTFAATFTYIFQSALFAWKLKKKKKREGKRGNFIHVHWQLLTRVWRTSPGNEKGENRRLFGPAVSTCEPPRPVEFVYPLLNMWLNYLVPLPSCPYPIGHSLERSVTARVCRSQKETEEFFILPHSSSLHIKFCTPTLRPIETWQRYHVLCELCVVTLFICTLSVELLVFFFSLIFSFVVQLGFRVPFFL